MNILLIISIFTFITNIQAWEYKLDGTTLTISGSGKMTDYNSTSKAPWFSDMSKITEVIIGDEITYIGSESFNGASSLSKVTIGKKIAKILPITCRDAAAIQIAKHTNQLHNIPLVKASTKVRVVFVYAVDKPKTPNSS